MRRNAGEAKRRESSPATLRAAWMTALRVPG